MMEIDQPQEGNEQIQRPQQASNQIGSVKEKLEAQLALAEASNAELLADKASLEERLRKQTVSATALLNGLTDAEPDTDCTGLTDLLEEAEQGLEEGLAVQEDTWCLAETWDEQAQDPTMRLLSPPILPRIPTLHAWICMLVSRQALAQDLPP